MFISKKLQFFQSPSRGGGVKNVRRSNLFQGYGGPISFFYRTCCFPGGSGLPVPSGFANCLCARVYVCGLLKSPKTKHAVSSSKA